VFQSVYRHELSHKPWKQKVTKIPHRPRRKAVAEIRLCVGHDCLGTHLHRIATRPDPYCMLCTLRFGHDCLGTHLHRIATHPDPYCMLCTLRFGHDCLGTHLHRTTIRPDPYCMLCTLRFGHDCLGTHLHRIAIRLTPTARYAASANQRRETI